MLYRSCTTWIYPSSTTDRLVFYCSAMLGGKVPLPVQRPPAKPASSSRCEAHTETCARPIFIPHRHSRIHACFLMSSPMLPLMPQCLYARSLARSPSLLFCALTSRVLHLGYPCMHASMQIQSLSPRNEACKRLRLLIYLLSFSLVTPSILVQLVCQPRMV